MRTRSFFSIILVCIGCGDSGSEAEQGAGQDVVVNDPPSKEEAAACEEGNVAKNAIGEQVVHCTRPFATAPFVRLPADDTANADVTFYGGITIPTAADDITTIWTRDGKHFIAVDEKNKPIPFDSKLPKSLQAPSNRVLFTIYQFKGKVRGQTAAGPFGPGTAIHLTSVRAVVMIEGCAFDSRLEGTWTGTVSERIEGAEGDHPFQTVFDKDKRVPIHLTFDKLQKYIPLKDDFRKDAKDIPDAPTFKLTGKIDNFSSDVTVNGVTYKSLQAMGNKNPFRNATDGKVVLSRLGIMHSMPNDAHWVLDYPGRSDSISPTGMSEPMTALSSASMLLDAGVSAPALQTFTVHPHAGAAGHTVILTPENVGAKIGQCN